MMLRIKTKASVRLYFQVKNAHRQWDLLSTTLFNTFLEVVIRESGIEDYYDRDE